ncbi:MAG: inorganic phosphate transporter [Bacteroidales bacterium]|jgi:PiT family inorganic phosphate transporter|nr:inorganic phosphate transporter [Bacteroidales bacterium]
MEFTLLIIIVVLAFAFDLINGFHDAANSIATVVSTKVLTPFQAVLWAAFFNFLAYLVFELHIADTIAKIVDTSAITLMVILAGIIAAIIWNLLTWYMGIPSSSSHTLVGGFAGAAIAYTGWDVVHTGRIIKIGAFIFLAPLLGMIISYLFSIALLWISRRGNPFRLDKRFKGFQLLSSALFSLGHGGNDAQKVMGIIAAALMVYFHGVEASAIPHWAQIETVNGRIHDIPHWIVLGCYTAISLGTLMGGWRIVKTMGTKITKLTPFEGVAAESAGAVLLFGTEAFGIPVSTTHTITGAIMGVGLTKRITAVRWGVTINLLYAWLLTIPVSMILAAVIYHLLAFLTGIR